jgi:hypothetical protein
MKAYGTRNVFETYEGGTAEDHRTDRRLDIPPFEGVEDFRKKMKGESPVARGMEGKGFMAAPILR